MVAAFDVVDVNPNPARFDLKKAEAINGDTSGCCAPDDFARRLVPYLVAEPAGPARDERHARRGAAALLAAAAPLVQERSTVLATPRGCCGSCSSTTGRSRPDADAAREEPRRGRRSGRSRRP